MKLMSLIQAAVAGILLLGATAQAETVRANIPFAFTAGDQTLPAGTYLVTYDRARSLLSLDAGPDANARLIAHVAQFGASQEPGMLLFHKYGDRYLLKQMKTSGTREGAEIAPGRSEREAIRRGAAFEVAMVTFQTR
jgi:hypothetical protein